jgi:hypothetical protein
LCSVHSKEPTNFDFFLSKQKGWKGGYGARSRIFLKNQIILIFFFFHGGSTFTCVQFIQKSQQTLTFFFFFFFSKQKGWKGGYGASSRIFLKNQTILIFFSFFMEAQLLLVFGSFKRANKL